MKLLKRLKKIFIRTGEGRMQLSQVIGISLSIIILALVFIIVMVVDYFIK